MNTLMVNMSAALFLLIRSINEAFKRNSSLYNLLKIASLGCSLFFLTNIVELDHLTMSARI